MTYWDVILLAFLNREELPQNKFQHTSRRHPERVIGPTVDCPRFPHYGETADLLSARLL